MTRHIPNFITLLNLLFGCIAIVMIMGVHPRFEIEQEQMFVIEGMNDIVWGSLFIILASVMDLFDGLAARVLKSYSPLGGDLDSLADLVSFGVAPAMIIYQLLWRAYMMEPGALQTPIIVMIPAFLIALAGAYRLARFNHTKMADNGFFQGLPIPAVGIFVAALPLVLFFNYNGLGSLLEQRWILYILIALLSYLMVSRINFLKWNTKTKGFLPQIIILIASIIGSIFFNFGGIVIGFIAYIIVSIIFGKSTKATI